MLFVGVKRVVRIYKDFVHSKILDIIYTNVFCYMWYVSLSAAGNLLYHSLLWYLSDLQIKS